MSNNFFFKEQKGCSLSGGIVNIADFNDIWKHYKQESEINKQIALPQAQHQQLFRIFGNLIKHS